MPVPKTGALPLGDSPIPVSGPAAGSERRRAAPERREVLAARERGAREDLPGAFDAAQRAACAPRFRLTFKDSEDAGAAAREHHPERARTFQRLARAADLGVEPHHDGLEIVRPHITE